MILNEITKIQSSYSNCVRGCAAISDVNSNHDISDKSSISAHIALWSVSVSAPRRTWLSWNIQVPQLESDWWSCSNCELTISHVHIFPLINCEAVICRLPMFAELVVRICISHIIHGNRKGAVWREERTLGNRVKFIFAQPPMLS